MTRLFTSLRQGNRFPLVASLLSLSAVALLVLNLLPTPSAIATEAVQDRDFYAVTAAGVRGGDYLYVLEKRSGLVAAMRWDNQARSVTVLDVRPIQNAFGGAGQAGGGRR